MSEIMPVVGPTSYELLVRLNEYLEDRPDLRGNDDVSMLRTFLRGYVNYPDDRGLKFLEEIRDRLEDPMRMVMTRMEVIDYLDGTTEYAPPVLERLWATLDEFQKHSLENGYPTPGSLIGIYGSWLSFLTMCITGPGSEWESDDEQRAFSLNLREHLLTSIGYMKQMRFGEAYEAFEKCVPREFLDHPLFQRYNPLPVIDRFCALAQNCMFTYPFSYSVLLSEKGKEDDLEEAMFWWEQTKRFNTNTRLSTRNTTFLLFNPLHDAYFWFRRMTKMGHKATWIAIWAVAIGTGFLIALFLEFALWA